MIIPKKLEFGAKPYNSKAKFTRFNKDLECYEGRFSGDLGRNSLVVVVAEAGMFQFFKKFRTSHSKSLTIVIECTKSCNQLGANISHFCSDGHQVIFEELKHRMTEVSELVAVMSPDVGNADPEQIVSCNFSSTDPIGVLLTADIST